MRLVDVVTISEHQRAGCGTLLAADVTEWAKAINADRVDRSATPRGQRICARAGFVLTSAPRMRLVL